jgi:hypothetical protein
MANLYAVKLVAVQIVVLDAENMVEARKLAIENPDGDWTICDSQIEQTDLSQEDVERNLRHGAYDLRTKEARV